MTPEITGFGFTILCGILGVIWWEIRALRKNSHALTNRLTSIVGKIGLLEHRVKKLEEGE